MYKCFNCCKINQKMFCKECFQISKIDIEKKISQYNNIDKK
jgi:hypothetical protein